jgi:hypothetical protein
VIAGRYTVQEHIGGGGMADVFQATDEELGVDVAIKLLKPRMASDELRARMVQEAQAAAQVRHSNLVRVFGTGKLDSTAYIVMELLDGPNLEQYLREYRAAHPLERGARAAVAGARGPARHPRAGLRPPGHQDRQHPRHPRARDSRRGRRDRPRPGQAGPGAPQRRQPADHRGRPPALHARLHLARAGRGAPSIAARTSTRWPSRSTACSRGACRSTTRAASPSRSPFARWPHAIVLAQALILLLAWWMTPAAVAGPRTDRPREPLHQLAETKVETELPPPVPTTPPEPPVADSAALPEQSMPPAPEASVPEPPVSRRPDLAAAARRALVRHGPAIQACADRTNGTSERLAVDVNIDTAGRVSAHVRDAADTPLSRCISQALQRTTLSPPPRPLSLVHVYTLRATPRRP